MLVHSVALILNETQIEKRPQNGFSSNNLTQNTK